MDSMDELRSPSLPTSPAAPIIVFPSPSMLSVLQLLGTIRCPEKPRAAHDEQGPWVLIRGVRLRRRHLLLGLFPVRSAVERHSRTGGRPALDRSRHDHVGHHLGGLRLYPGRDQLLCPALSARGRGGWILSRHHPLPHTKSR